MESLLKRFQRATIQKVTSTMKYQAFSLIELLVVITLVGITFTIAAPIGLSYIGRNSTVLARESVISTVREAQSKALNGVNDSNWGVYTNSTSIVAYRGSSYATRVVAEDLLIALPSGTVITSGVDLNFSKFSGETATARTLNVSSNNGAVAITVATNGLVSY